MNKYHIAAAITLSAILLILTACGSSENITTSAEAEAASVSCVSYDACKGSSADIFVATGINTMTIMSVGQTAGSDRTNDRLEYLPAANISLFEYSSIKENAELEPGKEISLLVLRSSEENPGSDPLYPESRYEDMLFISICVEINTK